MPSESASSAVAPWAISGHHREADDYFSVLPMIAGTTYPVKLRSKTIVQAGGATIYVGAGPIGGQYSPTRLSVI